MEPDEFLRGVEEGVRSRMDRDGSLAAFLETFSGPDGQLALELLAQLAGSIGAGLANHVSQVRRLPREIAEFIVLFAPRGWAPNERSDMGIFRAALDVYHATGELDGAERRLVEEWNRNDHLRVAVLPIQTLGAGSDKLAGVGNARWRLVEKAFGHHAAGAYEASVPIVLAQADGVAIDVGFKNGLFEKPLNRKPDARLDDSTLFGLSDTQTRLLPLFAAEARHTRAAGTLSRHGILHGRELGYDTLENSTKAFALLAAVIQWALPRSRELADART